MTTPAPADDEPKPMSLSEFFEGVPPSTTKHVLPAVGYEGVNGLLTLEPPNITLHCASDVCAGSRLFRSTDKPRLNWSSKNRVTNCYVYYFCRNCQQSLKTYALRVEILNTDEPSAGLMAVSKFGEAPAFGPPTPARVASLIGSDRELYFKGLRAENQGLGIAAFAYYRRVVEDRKGAIIDEIARVAKQVGGSAELLAELSAARNETQFSRAVDTVKMAIPPALLINGQNPLTLLHSALSEGLHADSDEVCLELATSIRIVLAAFVERVQSALSDEKQLNDAVTRLMQKSSNTKK
jgi:hypothetical protein